MLNGNAGRDPALPHCNHGAECRVDPRLRRSAVARPSRSASDARIRRRWRSGSDTEPLDPLLVSVTRRRYTTASRAYTSGVTDHDALVRAICAFPDDDTPRLIFADFLDERGEAERAAFVRAQVELVASPPWEPFAVRCRWRERQWSAASQLESVRGSLPDLPGGWNVAWHDAPFRRGFGWRVDVRSLVAFNQLAPRLFEQAPVGEIDLYAMDTLDDLREFAAAEWAQRLRVLHLHGRSPAEPVRALCEVPTPPPLTDVYFERSTSPGLGFVVTDLLKSPLYATVRGVHFRLGDGNANGLEDLFRALTHDSAVHERIMLANMGLTKEEMRWWCERGGLMRLRELDLRGNPLLGDDGLQELTAGLRSQPPLLVVLSLAGAGITGPGAETLARCEALAGLRSLDLSKNRFTARAIAALAAAPQLAGLRSLNLCKCQFGDEAVRRLVAAKFWPNLVELDLRRNPLTDAGARHLLRADVPPDLTALLLDARLGDRVRAALRAHFGEAVVFSAEV